MNPKPTRPFRLLIVTQHFWPALGGAETMLRRLAAEWTEMACEVTVLAERDEPAWPTVATLDGFRIVRTPRLRLRFFGSLRYMANVRTFLRETAGQFDLAYVSMLKHAAYACLTARGVETPIVLRAEGAGPTGDAVWQDSARFGRRIARVCRTAPAIVAPSSAIVEELVDRAYAPERLHRIPNGVPIPSEPWSRWQLARRRAALGLPIRPTVVYTGRLHIDKGLIHLVAAVAKQPDLQLVLVGDGPERAALEAAAQRLQCGDRVRFVGQVPDVEAWLRAADVFVLPSYQEGLSVALLEALALGMPTLASDIPGNRDVLPAELLPLFPVRDDAGLEAALERSLSYPPSDATLRRMRRSTTDGYGISAVARRHLELFAQVLANASQVGGMSAND